MSPDIESVCDFCNTFLDENEELHEVYVGKRENPSLKLNGRAEKFQMHAGYNKDRILSERVDFAEAMIRALLDSDNVLLNKYHRTMKLETEPVFQSGSDEPVSTVDTSFSAETDHDTVAVDIEIELEKSESPDLMVCSHCKEMLTGDTNE